MKILLILSLTFFTGLFFTPEKTHIKLQKEYSNNIEKCEILSKKYIAHPKKKATACFFLIKIAYDKYFIVKNNQSKGFQLNKSLKYLILLQKQDSNLIYDKNSVKEISHKLIDETLKFIPILKRNGLSNIVQILEIKLTKLGAINTSTTKLKSTDQEASKKESLFFNNQYFGLPIGNEEIESFSLNSEKEFLTILNKERIKRGLQELLWEEKLAKAARYHAYDLATQNYFSHSSKDSINGKLVEVAGAFERIRKFYKSGFVNTENIAAGNKSALDTYLQWYNSPGHNKNMFNSTSTKVGIGVYYNKESSYGYYWVFCTAQN